MVEERFDGDRGYKQSGFTPTDYSKPWKEIVILYEAVDPDNHKQVLSIARAKVVYDMHGKCIKDNYGTLARLNHVKKLLTESLAFHREDYWVTLSIPRAEKLKAMIARIEEALDV